jgi:hypothetical protein
MKELGLAVELCSCDLLLPAGATTMTLDNKYLSLE